MKRLPIILLAMCCFAVVNGFAQAASNIAKTDLSQAEVDRIVKKFTANERLFREALGIYVFNRSASISTIGMGGQITGTYRRDSFLAFNPDGTRVERIEFAPIPTLTEIVISAADIDDLGGVNPFAIDPKMADKYNFSFVGKERIDELDLYVFDVSPKVMPDVKRNGVRMFSGRIWVDDKDLLIVKSKGKGVPEGKERFPIIETWRANVDGKYWFPVYSSSDDELVFENGNVVKMKVRLKYTNYRVGRTDVTIVGEEEDVPAEKPAPAPAPTPAPKKP